MAFYIVRRVLLLFPVLFVVAVIAFFITNFMPGDPVRLMLGDFVTEAQVQEMNTRLGLDQPIPIRFFLWLQRLLIGDLGQSLFLHIPVTTAILSRLEPTLILAFLGQALAVVVGVPLGILSAVKERSVLGQFSALLAIGGLSIPSFWLAISLILFFGVHLGWLPVAGYQSIFEAGPRALRYCVLPMISIGVMHSGLLARMTRSAMLDVLQQDYMRTARAKGLQQYRVVLKHGLRNAGIPILTVLGASFSTLLAGTWIVEVVYNIPGTGSLAITAIMRRDYPLIQGAIIFIAVIYVFMNLLIDLSYAFLDPKIKLD